MDKIINEEDKAFLASMKSGKLASFGVADRKKACKKKLSLSFSESYSEFTASSDGIEEIPKQKKRRHHRLTYTGTPVLILHVILKRPSVVSVATRLNISPSQEAALTKVVIEELGGDTSCVAKSLSTEDKGSRSTTHAK
ncbi:unnamed protein product [Lepeophtheirus salmonis]|uniref:(salmon louse) hypothetical protein n=1 Tax=Lepeophtheirus salmonis TaxID=72036 RepID=A0A7R8D389_LEPSM|nr:unnamed protein product [Lepeophtheirus salmonis]CAF3010238.1 unnamed protein product [Lepeophtheirus salmonis]